MSEASPAAPIASRKQRWFVRFVRVAGWVVLILGLLALAGRIVRITIEGIESVEWFQILCLCPLGFIACGVLWLLSARQLQRARWVRSFAIVICGVLALVASVQMSERLYDQYMPEDAEANSYPWVEFDIPDSPFLISLPHLPKREEEFATTSFGDVKIAMYTASDLPFWYACGISEHREGVVDLLTSDGEDFASQVSDSTLAKRPGSRALSRKRIELSGWVGIEEEIEMPSSQIGKKRIPRPFIVIRRLYVRAGQMVQLMVLIERSTYEQDKAEVHRNAERFLNSIHIDPSTDERI